MEVNSILNDDYTYTVKMDDEARETMGRLCRVTGENSCQVVDRGIKMLLALQVVIEETNKKSGT